MGGVNWFPGGVGGGGGGGAPGKDGAAGAVGPYGGALTFDYKFSSSTANADPGEGFLRFNNASTSGSTALYVSTTPFSGVAPWWVVSMVAGVTSVIKARFRFFKKADPSTFLFFTCTGATSAGGYMSFAIANVTGSGDLVFANGDEILWMVDVTGDAGSAGVASVDAPALMPGFAWLRGESLVGANGSGITTWQNDALPVWPAIKTGTMTMETVGGHRCARMAGAGRLDFVGELGGYNVANPPTLSVFAVFTPSSAAAVQFLLCAEAQSKFMLCLSRNDAGMTPINGPGLYLTGGAGGAIPEAHTALVVGTRYLLETHLTQPDDVTMGMNGALTRSQLSGAAYPAWSVPNLRVGQDPAGGEGAFMDLFELFVCPVLGVPQRDFVREYYRLKFNIY